jgi:hypothetical protein
MKNLKLRCIETFLIQKFVKIIIFKWYIFIVFLDFTFKFPRFHMDFLTNHMSSDIYKMIYKYFLPKA